MTDLACRMVAARPGEVDATMVVTPANAALIATTVTRAAGAPAPLPVPGRGSGGRRGVPRSATHLRTHGAWRVHHAVELAQPIHEELLREHHPDAIVADAPFLRTTDVAANYSPQLRVKFHCYDLPS